MKGRSLAALLGLVVADAAAAADFLVEVRVDVQRGCQLVHQTRDAGAQAQGLLDFGRTARLDDPQGPLTGALLQQRPHVWNATPIRCTR